MMKSYISMALLVRRSRSSGERVASRSRRMSKRLRAIGYSMSGANDDGNGSTLSFGATVDVTSVLYTTPASPSPSETFVTTALTSSSFETTFFSTAAWL